MDQSIFKLVEKTILEAMDERTRPPELTPESRLEDDLKLGSLRTVELIIALEDTLDVSIPDDELASLETLGDLVDLIAARLGEGNPLNG